MKVKHPGTTKAERRVLDEIGCGQSQPRMTPGLQDSMLRKGLIVITGYQTLGKDAFGAIKVPNFEMPIPIHMQWCNAMAAQHPEEE